LDGLSALGPLERGKYGVFPIGGNFLNASKAIKEILNSIFIKDLMIILGLKAYKKYTDKIF
jgi:DNA gyrase/topoisomerase IV subunit B